MFQNATPWTFCTSLPQKGALLNKSPSELRPTEHRRLVQTLNQMKKKLLIVLGAGSSVETKMPSVGDIDNLMQGWSAAWASKNGLSDYYLSVWNAINTYLTSGGTASGPPINFERALGELFALAHWLSPAPFGNALTSVVPGAALPAGLTFRSSHHFGRSYDITDNAVQLLVDLAAHMRAASLKLNTHSDSFKRHRRLLKRLRRSFDVGIYNLNYDAVALAGWLSAFTGFDAKGRFDAKRVHRRRRWGFIYHLHGSVHHSLKGDFADELVWKNDLADSFDDGDAALSQKGVSDGKRLPKTTLIAGGFKLDQLLTQPFQSFYSSLVRHVQLADAILLGGYGFGDVHVNQALYSRLHTRSRRPPVMILDYGKGKDPIELRNDLWAIELCATLRVTGEKFYEPPHKVPPDIHDLISRKGFEVNSEGRVAIWHGGFTAAVDRIDVIAKWLARRAEDTDLSGLTKPR